MKETNSSLEELFDRALRIGAANERSAFLDAHCLDAGLRRQVDRLLRAHRAAGDFLETEPPIAKKAESATENPLAELNRARTKAEQLGNTLVASGAQNLPDETMCSVMLRDPAAQGNEPLLKPLSPEMPDRDPTNRYRLDGEIARGGMGAILKGRDVDLGRELAIKVLLDANKDKPLIVQRFIEEAQIGGQLQHPGIAPLYELGRFGDGRLFFAMKLVRGETLASHLADRRHNEDRRAELLNVFEQICQTMAYVHSRGVIHRDLKPANIMVGAFGEVQVMDWGLAKVLRSGGVADERKAHGRQRHGTDAVQTLRDFGSQSGSGFGSDLISGNEGASGTDSIGSPTLVGSVMGTPAYMAPEQARGRTGNLDERSDVFGLGAMLCEILTGKPPYVADSGREVFQRAYRADLADAYARLDRASIDSELRQIASRSIDKDPAKRFQHAGELADALVQYGNAVQERLKQVELERAEAQARSEEMQRRRKLHHLIGAMLLIGCLATALAATHFRSLEQTQRKLVSEKSVLAHHNANLAQQRAHERQLAIEARVAADKARDVAVKEQAKTQVAQNLAESRLHEARKNLYAAQLAHVSQTMTDREAISRLRKVIDYWIPQHGEPDFRDWEWYYLYAQTQLDTVRLRGPVAFNLIQAVWTPDDAELLTLGQNGRPMFRWNPVTGQRVGNPMKFGALNGHVAEVKFSPNAKSLALMGASQGNRSAHFGIYDSKTFELKTEIVDFDVPGPLAFSPDGTLLALNAGTQLAVVDPQSGAPEWTLTIPEIEDSPVFSAGATWQIHRDLCWTSDGIRFAVIKEQRVCLYDYTSSEPIAEIPFAGSPQQLKLSPDGEFLAVHVDQPDFNIELWQLHPTPQLIHRFTIAPDEAGYFGFAWHPDCSYLAVTNGTFATVYRMADGASISQHQFDERTVHLTWNSDGSRLASAGMYGHADVWDPVLMTGDIHLGPHEGFSWSRDGQRLCGWTAATLTVWDARDWRVIRELETTAPIRDASLDGKQNRVAIAHSNATVTTWDFVRGKQVLPPIAVEAQSLDIHPTKDLLVTGWTNTVRVFDLSLGKQVDKTNVFAEWANWAYNSRWFPGQDAVIISSSHGGAAGWVDFRNRKLRYQGRGNVAMSSTGEYWLNVPITKRGIQVSRRDPAGNLELVHQVDVGAGWELDVNNSGSRILLPTRDALSLLHCETDTPLIRWAGESGPGQWDSFGLRVASLTDGQLVVRDPIAGFAKTGAAILLPWLRSLLDGRRALSVDRIRHRYSVVDLVATAVINEDWELALQLCEKLGLTDNELRLLKQFHAPSVKPFPREGSPRSDATLRLEREFWQNVP